MDNIYRPHSTVISIKSSNGSIWCSDGGRLLFFCIFSEIFVAGCFKFDLKLSEILVLLLSTMKFVIVLSSKCLGWRSIQALQSS